MSHSEIGADGEAIVFIDGTCFRILIPPPKPGSRGASTALEVIVLDRCANEECQLVIPIERLPARFCSDPCKSRYHYLLHKTSEEILADSKYLPFKH